MRKFHKNAIDGVKSACYFFIERENRSGDVKMWRSVCDADVRRMFVNTGAKEERGPSCTGKGMNVLRGTGKFFPEPAGNNRRKFL